MLTVSLACVLAVTMAPPSFAATTICSTIGGCHSAGRSTFAWENNLWNSYWDAFAGHNCTNYVAYRLITTNGMSAAGSEGNASTWGIKHAGITNSTPARGSVAWWNASAGLGDAGHVAYVEDVLPDGSIVLSEDSWDLKTDTGNVDHFAWQKLSPGAGWPTGFIHFKDISPDGDGDGVPDASDWCPVVRGFASWRGCLPFGDFNGDGRSDVIWYEQGTGQAHVLISNGSNGFSSSPWIKGYGRPDWAGTGDFNGDGRSDVIWYEQGTGQAHVLISNGSNGFSSSPWIKGYGRPDWAGTGAFSSTNGAGYPPLQNLAAPTIAGAPKVGSVLTVSTGSWTPLGAGYTYQWFAGSAPISGATSASYVPAPADLGKTLKVQVTASRTGYWPVSATSQGAVVQAPDQPASGTNPPTGLPPQQPAGTTDSAARLSITARATAKRSKLRIDVDPDQASNNYELRVVKRVSGRWKIVTRTATKGPRDTRTINLPRGLYRVTATAPTTQATATTTPIRLQH